MKKEKLNIGVIGCGNIAEVYIPNMIRHFPNIEVVACASRTFASAKKACETFGVERALTVDELLADKTINLVVNLTVPQAHYELNKRILEAGKHVYCEKPFALTFEEAKEVTDLAKEKGLYAVAAPDTFLGSSLQTMRKLLDDGTIGRVTGFTANSWQHGCELWHPAPWFSYQIGGGPVMDLANYFMSALIFLLGPVKEIYCKYTCPTPMRPIKGELFEVEVNTFCSAVVTFESGITGTILSSYDIWQSQLPPIEVYGDDGVLYGSDPIMFGGSVKHYDGRALEAHINECEGFFEKLMAMHGPGKTQFLKDVPSLFPEDDDPHSNMRGLGVADLASAILTGRSPRVSGDFSLHLLEALAGFQISSDENRVYQMTTTCSRPAPMPEGLGLWEMD